MTFVKLLESPPAKWLGPGQFVVYIKCTARQQATGWYRRGRREQPIDPVDDGCKVTDGEFADLRSALKIVFTDVAAPHKTITFIGNKILGYTKREIPLEMILRKLLREYCDTLRHWTNLASESLFAPLSKAMENPCTLRTEFPGGKPLVGETYLRQYCSGDSVAQRMSEWIFEVQKRVILAALPVREPVVQS
jgi:hypothetical protein